MNKPPKAHDNIVWTPTSHMAWRVKLNWSLTKGSSEGRTLVQFWEGRDKVNGKILVTEYRELPEIY